MRIIFIVMLLGLLLLQTPVPKAEAVSPVCPAGYEHGYVWMGCASINGEGCYGIRDNGMTNSIISCPQVCCDKPELGQWVEVR